ncbi:hypothetical protein RM780_20340 [Streptomyces sp. DSM 44917]|uniref:Fluoride ion transporter CrcB n=2 Tax=Streptomyces boetiae TaxID=3075541 RepID=A0ABU2LDC7_9ACTN|nr:hypothetical protein [Streptomyces sp. DSM 44917]MDT0309292.1 hypothetical protein [Streptomyces sp. DSM 44917]
MAMEATAGWALRAAAALGLLGSAWIHLVVWQDWARDEPVVGELFLVNAVAGPVLAAAVLAWRGHWLPELGTAGFGAATLLAYAASLTTGFLGVREQFRTPEETWGVVTEAACLLAGVLLLLIRRRARR